MTADLVQFLRSRLDEDEAVAQGATGSEWGDVDPQQPYVIWDVQAREKNRTLLTVGRLATAERAEDRAHIARHDPARVLCEVAAKRRIVDHLASELSATDTPWWYDDRLTPALKALALPYADHPDYRDEWRP
jgi:hypothetical protein